MREDYDEIGHYVRSLSRILLASRKNQNAGVLEDLRS
jgi:hypothetical protein